MMKITEKGKEAIKAILRVKLHGFTAKELSNKSGVAISPQSLSALAKKGILDKIENTSPVEYRFALTYEEGQCLLNDKPVERLVNDKVVRTCTNIPKDNKHSQYKLIIENRVKTLVGEEAPQGYEYMFTLSGKYLELTKYDTTGKNYPKTQPIMLNKVVDDKESFEQAWNDIMNFKLIIM